MLGLGILRGMFETARNMIGSYFDPERMVTVQYPEQRLPTKENYRSFPFLVHDGDDPEKGLRCTACLTCEKECPPQCIFIVPGRDEKGKPTRKPAVFDIDISVCMSCQICVEVCPFDAIKMDQIFELSTQDRFGGLLLHKEQLARPNSYFQDIHPRDAVAVDGKLADVARKRAALLAKAPAAAKPNAPTETPNP
jgi:NADH-quinone oxidoreductase subunit I